MDKQRLLGYIARGRTDYMVDLMRLPDWKDLLHIGEVKIVQWLVYYNDLTAIKMIMEKGGDLSSIDINEELGNAAFFGHWQICNFLTNAGAEVNYRIAETGETPLHNALAKAGRPYYFYTVKVLVEAGADVNVKTKIGIETGSFMRDVKTKGESPLHRAAAYADYKTIEYLIDNGAKKDSKDCNDHSPLSWASEHLRPGKILSLLAYGEHRIGQGHITKNTSDHGQAWGNSMDWNLFGDYLPD